MNLSREKLRQIIEEEVINLAEDEDEFEEVDVEEEFDQPAPEEMRAQMPVEELAQVVMRLVKTHPEGEEVLKQALIELYDIEVEEYEEDEPEPGMPIGPDADPVISPIGFKETLERLVTEMMGEDYDEEGTEDPSEEDRGAEQMGHAQSAMDLAIPFDKWVAEAKAIGFEFGTESPNPYDAWLQGATPQEYTNVGGVEELEEVIKQEGDNYVVKSEDGKTLGTHSSRKKAQAQLDAIHKSQEEGD